MAGLQRALRYPAYAKGVYTFLVENVMTQKLYYYHLKDIPKNKMKITRNIIKNVTGEVHTQIICLI